MMAATKKREIRSEMAVAEAASAELKTWIDSEPLQTSLGVSTQISVRLCPMETELLRRRVVELEADIAGSTNNLPRI